ncbi:hypothetical protein LOC67_05655 [Stieleria sp. JC731]|uniref:hypothetical protein n=1 Tax=Pirellulaceae TaxID=2691357 RepID=UPI001E3C77CB|nr:hypothetical protein [Stieleria sp. JC731]MCC9600039.1 hypothetical protein [Stieleria sp. JC731]
MPGQLPEKVETANDQPKLDSNTETQTPSSTPSGAAVESDSVTASSPDRQPWPDVSPLSPQWTALKKQVLQHCRATSAKTVFGKAAKSGELYRWGLSMADNQPGDDDLSIDFFSRVACDAAVGGHRFADIDLNRMLADINQLATERGNELRQATIMTMVAAALPGLLRHLDESRWWDLLGTIQGYREHWDRQNTTHPASAIAVAEIGLTLSILLQPLPSCRRMLDAAIAWISDWSREPETCIRIALEHPGELRLQVASILRCQAWLDHLAETTASKKKRLLKQIQRIQKTLDEIGKELTFWMLALTRGDGTAGFSRGGRASQKADLGSSGLLKSATEMKPELFAPALNSLLGRPSTKRRLSWISEFPEPLMHHEGAKLACMLPEWDSRRGRVLVNYKDEDFQIELSTGKSALISGNLECEVIVDGRANLPTGNWELTCEYTDDDVHYLEFEQPYENGFSVQRQVGLIRDDRCFFIADAVIQEDYLSDASKAQKKIEYYARFPVFDGIECVADSELNETFLNHETSQALVLPLAADEWREARSDQKLAITNEGNLLLSDHGTGQLFSPLWIDLSRKRFKSRRTWRQLTVGEQLYVLPRSTAAAYRIQSGTSQWILYRSLHEGGPRSFFGKQMITDFFAARFHAHDQSWEQLIIVEGNEDHQ